MNVSDSTKTSITPRAASRVLVTGATGYIGGRLVERLAGRDVRLRCLTRRPSELADRLGAECEVVRGDVLDPASLTDALTGVDVAYYLVHSMASDGNFEEDDRRGARNFAEAAAAAGLRRIVYLGGLGDGSDELSPHLRSRHEVGRILGSTGVPVTEFRGSIIIGSGSLSFEMVRALVERLPLMITPKWVYNEAQPIAVEDVLDYLEAELRRSADPGKCTESKVYEIGGADAVCYADIMSEYARQRGLKRVMLPVPVLTPRLSGLWLGLVTPLFARVGRKLIDSISHPTVVRDRQALVDFAIRPMGLAPAIAAALRNEDREFATTRWSDASSAAPAKKWGGRRYGNRLLDTREATVATSPEQAFRAVERIGGANGWYFADSLWTLRGALDLLAGGVGMRRGRRDPDRLRADDVLDCWRVESCERPRSLRLRAEMRLPGRAWLEFVVEPRADGAVIRQTATFDPQGLAGLLYWYGIYPLHELVFRGMIRNLAARAASDQGATS